MAVKTKNKNQKKRRRGGKNEFWLVMDTRCNQPLLFARKPYKISAPNTEYAWCYKDGFYWFSRYGEYYPSLNVMDRLQFGHKTPIKVKLVICDDENPDLYIQRWKDCLFFSGRIERLWICGDKDREVIRVSHNLRLSNKLFPDITEESGIVGVKIFLAD